MKLKDSVDFIGKFSIKSIKKDGTVEVLEEKNLIMDGARHTMAGLVGGINKPINKLVIGTKGHVGSNILNPIQAGADVDGFDVGFVTTRTQLFSEEIGSTHFIIPFDASSTSNEVSVISNGYFASMPTTTNQCEVTRTIVDRTITYTITIPEDAANDSSNNAIAYTEAALYTGSTIFSMKTFSARVKEDSTRLEITWSIVF